MDIVIDSLLDGARRAEGAVAVIDVFRAFTTAAVVLAGGARHIVMTGSVSEALALRAAGVGTVCMGEVEGVPVAEFEYGNSPYQVSGVDFADAVVIQRTSAGTQGIAAAAHAPQLFAAALVTARATARALVATGAGRVTLVAMGWNAAERTDEDEVCALHLRNVMQGRGADADALRRVIVAGAPAQALLDPAKPHFHPGDLEIALDVDRYDFAIRVTMEDGRPVARRA